MTTKTNNYYYKTIYETVTGETVTGFHMNSWYMKNVNIANGHTYTSAKPLNLYVRDFAEDILGSVPSKHKPLRYYLREVAEELGGTLEHQNINYYLKIISENYSPDAPTVASLSLAKTDGKQILSYTDKTTTGNTEYCTLTATALDENDNPVSGQSVVFKNGDTTLDTVTTDSNGEASYTYVSQGVGDVSIKAECSSLIQTYTLEDCFRYDDASTDKTSNYTLSTIGSFTHDTDHYILSRTRNDSSSTNYYSSCYIDDTLPSDFEISVDYMYTSATNETQSGLQITNAHITTYSGVNECLLASRKGDMGILYRVSGSLTRYLTTPGKSLNVWYNLLLKIDGTSVTAKITKVSDDTVLYNQTETLSNIQSWKKWQIVLGESSQTVQWKNFKIKPL